MNREAVALGTPVFTSFEGRLGAVDEQLIAEGRLQAPARPGRGRRRQAAAGESASAGPHPPRPARLHAAARSACEPGDL